MHAVSLRKMNEVLATLLEGRTGAGSSCTYYTGTSPPKIIFYVLLVYLLKAPQTLLQWVLSIQPAPTLVKSKNFKAAGFCLPSSLVTPNVTSMVRVSAEKQEILLALGHEFVQQFNSLTNIGQAGLRCRGCKLTNYSSEASSHSIQTTPSSLLAIVSLACIYQPY